MASLDCIGRGTFAPDRIEARYRSSPCVHEWRFISFQHPSSALGESLVNANVSASANGIAAQPSPSAAVAVEMYTETKSVCMLV
jgi:hypothetical protein